MGTLGTPLVNGVEDLPLIAAAAQSSAVARDTLADRAAVVTLRTSVRLRQEKLQTPAENGLEAVLNTAVETPTQMCQTLDVSAWMLEIVKTGEGF